MKLKVLFIFFGDLVLIGFIVFEGEVQLDGIVDGDICVGFLIIGEEVNVNGEVMVEIVVICGCVLGFVYVCQVQLVFMVCIEGDIVYVVLFVESGVFFDGYCCYVFDLLSEKFSGGVFVFVFKVVNKFDDMLLVLGKFFVMFLDFLLVSKFLVQLNQNEFDFQKMVE